MGLAFGGELSSGLDILRYANRVPLLFDAGSCVITSSARNIDWKRYRVDDVDRMPLALLVNVVSVHVPYTSTGKQSVASEEEIYEEIRLAVMEVARRLAKYLGGKHRKLYQAKRRKTFEKYVPEVSRALSILTGISEGEIKEMLVTIIEKKFESIEEQAVEAESNA